jgi:hypothetical protein
MLAGGPGQAEISSETISRHRGSTSTPNSSMENAAGVNAVREVLGYHQIIYYGAPYGSQLGQHVTRTPIVVFPGRTHVQIAGVNLCAAAVMTQFVLDSTASLDTSCTEASPLLGFVPPDGTTSTDG